MKHNIFDNGVINYSAMQQIVYDGSISETIKSLNKMWNKFGGYFDMCVVTRSASILGNKWPHSGTEYDYLRIFHCRNWSSITEISREGMAAVIISYLNSKRIGYDRDSAKFIDLKPSSIEEMKPSSIENSENIVSKNKPKLSKTIINFINKIKKRQ